MPHTIINPDIIFKYLTEVFDPEIPVLDIVAMGVVRDVKVDGGHVEVIITPTYSGCPAMKVIEDDIRAKLKEKGVDDISVRTVLSPSWTTDWMTEEGKEKLREYGIAPPAKGTPDKSVLFGKPKEVNCPRCGSSNTEMKSQFGSTACKALYFCKECLEPFDYFKCI